MSLTTKRICAFLIDWYLIMIPVYFIWSSGGEAYPTVAHLLPRAIVSGIVTISYFSLKDLLFRNASIGKKILGLKVENANNGVAPVKSLLQRNFLLLFLIHVEIICLFVDIEHRRLGDKWANTRVVIAR